MIIKHHPDKGSHKKSSFLNGQAIKVIVTICYMLYVKWVSTDRFWGPDQTLVIPIKKAAKLLNKGAKVLNKGAKVLN